MMNPEIYSRACAALFGGVLVIVTGATAYAQNWENSPYNFKNSPYNFQNSPYNFRNSPYNFDNSQYNYGANNGIYTPNGSRQGYAAPRADGSGVNLFDSNGNPMGYHNY